MPRRWGGSLHACMERINTYLRGWMSHFRICTDREVRIFQGYDARIRRRLRAIIIQQKKRPRFLFRHLLASGVPRDPAYRVAYSSRGVWHRSARYGMHKAYGLAWFAERLVSLWAEWRRLNAPRVASGQILLFDL